MATKTEHSSSQNTRWINTIFVVIVIVVISMIMVIVIIIVKLISETITEVICHSAGEQCGGSMYYSCKQVTLRMR